METTTLSIDYESRFDKRLIEDNKGVLTASLVLELVENFLKRTAQTGSIEIPVHSAEDFLYRRKLFARIMGFNEYARTIDPERIRSRWWKHYGAMIVPPKGRNGQIHCYLLDDGLLSDAIAHVPKLSYKERSSFFLNYVMNGRADRELMRIKGNIHLHVINIASVDGDSPFAIKMRIAAEHESHGNFMEEAGLLAISFRKLCTFGGIVRSNPDLAVNDPAWFGRQFPKWRGKP